MWKNLMDTPTVLIMLIYHVLQCTPETYLKRS